ncbi:MAG: peptidase T [Planctomycetes bacterium]|nr:peptidase T [Planctomycetota bacterium]
MEFTVDREALLARFLAYCRIDTQSDENSTTCPSTPKQKDLSRLLVEELQALGLEDAAMDEHGYVYATLPENFPPTHPRRGRAPTLGLIAHVDTSPAVSGQGVNPIVHRDYPGGAIPLPQDPSIRLTPETDAPLGQCIGHDIVTADGTTLLGADNKAGIAEILATLETLRGQPEILHGPIRVAFTPDEEIGRGADKFDVKRFGAVAAYTVDGGEVGVIEDETFCADTVIVTCKGINVHPGYAKDRMVNSIKMAAALLEHFPPDRLSPETTEKREGYIHPYTIQGDEEKTVVKILIRDFEAAGLADKEDRIRGFVAKVKARFPKGDVDFEVKESYRNMKAVLDRHPEVGALAERATAAAGLEVGKNPIRGGTDGARLSFMGLPTPNLFTGAHNFHSKREWVSLDNMVLTVRTLVHLVRLWGECNSTDVA